MGYILGVMKKELIDTTGSEKTGYNNNLYMTAILQDENIKDIRSLIEKSQDQKESNNQIGFYVSCELGMAFTYHNLLLLMLQYRNFRNSVMIVYDINKSQFGMNPVRCFRLSKEAVDALGLEDMQKISENVSLVQDKIDKAGLSI